MCNVHICGSHNCLFATIASFLLIRKAAFGSTKTSHSHLVYVKKLIQSFTSSLYFIWKTTFSAAIKNGGFVVFLRQVVNPSTVPLL